MQRKPHSVHAALRAMALSISLLPALGGVARGTMISFSTPSGATGSGGVPVNARATFITGTGTVTVTLENLQAGFVSADQSLTDITFGLSNGTAAATLLSSLGMVRTVNSDKSFTDLGMAATHWRLSTYQQQIVLDDGWYTGAGPAYSIIGPATGADYPKADRSLAGSKSNNPFLAGAVTFVLGVPGVTTATKITQASFYFGQCEQCVTGKMAHVPEPAALVIATVSAALGGVWWWRRMARRPN